MKYEMAMSTTATARIKFIARQRSSTTVSTIGSRAGAGIGIGVSGKTVVGARSGFIPRRASLWSSAALTMPASSKLSVQPLHSARRHLSIFHRNQFSGSTGQRMLETSRPTTLLFGSVKADFLHVGARVGTRIPKLTFLPKPTLSPTSSSSLQLFNHLWRNKTSGLILQNNNALYHGNSIQRIQFQVTSASTLHNNNNNSQRVITRQFSVSNAKPPTPPPKSSFFQNLTHELHLLLQDLQLFLPRIIACTTSVLLFMEYGFKTVPCEGPSMEPTIMDGRNTVVLMEMFSHRLFGLEEEHDKINNSDDGMEDGNIGNIVERRVDATDTINTSNTKTSNITTSSSLSSFISPETWSSYFKLLQGIWKQHFQSGLQRGDVIILQHPNKEGTICKRIIGMPGDVIVRNDGGGSGSGGSVDNESGTKYDEILHSNTEKVPPGHLWIEGDNAPQSHDSRAYGAVPASLVIGKVICRLWPLRDYELVDRDANGRDIWRRIDGRIGRGERPDVERMGRRRSGFEGSHVLNDVEDERVRR